MRFSSDAGRYRDNQPLISSTKLTIQIIPCLLPPSLRMIFVEVSCDPEIFAVQEPFSGDGTPHGDSLGLFEMAVRNLCRVHPSQITADAPEFDLKRQQATQQRAQGSCLNPAHR